MLSSLQRSTTDPNNGALQDIQPPTDPVNLLAWLVIGVMVFFIFFGSRFTSREPPEDLKANMHRRNLDDDNFDGDNNDNDDGIH